MKLNKKRISVFILMIMMIVGCCSSVFATSFSKTEKTTYRRLTQVEKFSPTAACAIMGAMKEESGMNYSKVNKKYNFIGCMQWGYGKADALKKAAKKEKKSWKDGAVQRKFLKSDLKNNHPGIYKNINKSKNYKYSCDLIVRKYLRSADPERCVKTATKYAKKYYDNRKSLK